MWDPVMRAMETIVAVAQVGRRVPVVGGGVHARHGELGAELRVGAVPGRQGDARGPRQDGAPGTAVEAELAVGAVPGVVTKVSGEGLGPVVVVVVWWWLWWRGPDL